MVNLSRRLGGQAADYAVCQSNGKKQVKTKRNGQKGMKPIAKNKVKYK